ncbi:MAG TPA: YlcI/YnfO family protein [Thermoanaerobaculia bacterium]|nr:YlcI/YnfO family protein [Thermoanaerobaculia bacterium]
MSTLSLRLPDSLHRTLRELAKREGVSMNQLISSAAGEKVAAILTVDYLEERAARGSREKFEAVLAKVPDVEPEARDRLPDRLSRKRRAVRKAS